METKNSTANKRTRAKGANHTATHGTAGAKAAGHQSGTAPPESIKALQKRIGTPVWKRNVKREWLVDGFIDCGSLSLLIGISGRGKSFVAMQLAKSIALGEEFLGRKVEQRPVLYVDGEMADYEVKERLTKFGFDFNSPDLENRLLILGAWCKEPSNGPADAEIIAFAEETKGLIIFDTLIHWHPSDENNPTDTRRYMKLFLHLAHTCGATVQVLAHASGKSGGKRARDARGSSEIPAMSDVTFLVESRQDNSQCDAEGNRLSLIKNIHVTGLTKARSGRFFEAYCTLVPGKGLVAAGTEPLVSDEPKAPSERETQKQRAFEFIASNEGTGYAAVAEALSVTWKVAKGLFDALAEDGRVENFSRSGQGRRAKLRAKVSEKPFPDLSDVPAQGPVQ